MDNKARYTLVGFFVLSFSIAMVAFVLWLARYDVNKDKLKEYRLYVSNSIAGLNENSIVYYKGLNIGIVETIQINPKNLEEIEVILKISQPELIKTNTVASLESQGVTGNKTIELSGGTQEAPLLQAQNNAYAIIPVKDSFFTTLTSQASNIGQKVDIVLSQIAKLLNNQNLEKIDAILLNTQNSTQQLTKVLDSADNLIENSNSLVNNNLKSSLEQFDVLMQQDIKATLEKIDALSLKINSVGDNVNTLLQQDIKELILEFKATLKGAQSMEEIIQSADETVEKLQTTIENFNHNGGDMLFKTRKTLYGPGEAQ